MTTERKAGGTKETVRTLAYALGIALFVRTFALSESMCPPVPVGSRPPLQG